MENEKLDPIGLQIKNLTSEEIVIIKPTVDVNFFRSKYRPVNKGILLGKLATFNDVALASERILNQLLGTALTRLAGGIGEKTILSDTSVLEAKIIICSLIEQQLADDFIMNEQRVTTSFSTGGVNFEQGTLTYNNMWETLNEIVREGLRSSSLYTEVMQLIEEYKKLIEDPSNAGLTVNPQDYQKISDNFSSNIVDTSNYGGSGENTVAESIDNLANYVGNEDDLTIPGVDDLTTAVMNIYGEIGNLQTLLITSIIKDQVTITLDSQVTMYVSSYVRTATKVFNSVKGFLYLDIQTEDNKGIIINNANYDPETDELEILDYYIIPVPTDPIDPKTSSIETVSIEEGLPVGSSQEAINIDKEEKIIAIDGKATSNQQGVELNRNDIDLIFDLVTLEGTEQVLDIYNTNTQSIAEFGTITIAYDVVIKDTLGMTNVDNTTLTVKQELLDNLDISKVIFKLQSNEDDATGTIKAYNITQATYVGQTVNFQIRRKDTPLDVPFAFDEFYIPGSFNVDDEIRFELTSTRRAIDILYYSYSIINFKESSIQEILNTLQNHENRITVLEALAKIVALPLSVGSVAEIAQIPNSYTKMVFDGVPSIDEYNKWDPVLNEYTIDLQIDNTTILPAVKFRMEYVSGTNTGATFQIYNETKGITLGTVGMTPIENTPGLEQERIIVFPEIPIAAGTNLEVGDRLVVMRKTDGSAVVWKQLTGCAFNIGITKIGLEFSSSANSIYRDPVQLANPGYVENSLRIIETGLTNQQTYFDTTYGNTGKFEFNPSTSAPTVIYDTVKKMDWNGTATYSYQELDMDTNPISNLGTPTETHQATNKSYVDGKVAGFNNIDRTGIAVYTFNPSGQPSIINSSNNTTITFASTILIDVPINANDKLIFNLSDPVNEQDATNKRYVDARELPLNGIFITAALNEIPNYGTWTYIGDQIIAGITTYIYRRDN